MSQPRLNALVVDEKMFRHLVVLEMPKAMRLQYPISVLTIVRADGTGESLAGIVRRLAAGGSPPRVALRCAGRRSPPCRDRWRIALAAARTCPHPRVERR